MIAARKARAAGGRPARNRRAGAIRIKRAYDRVSAADGMRIFVDRLWPRGLSKATFHYDSWPRNLAPSSVLRKWYGHEPTRFAEFARRYRRELRGQEEAIGAIRDLIGSRTATLLTATRELDLSHAQILRDLLAASKR